MNDIFDSPLIGVDVRVAVEPESIGFIVGGIFVALFLSMFLAGLILKKI